jgi:hypothetical protein
MHASQIHTTIKRTFLAGRLALALCGVLRLWLAEPGGAQTAPPAAGPAQDWVVTPTAPTAPRLAQQLAMPPLAVLGPAQLEARAQLERMDEWNRRGEGPVQNGFARPLPHPALVVLASSGIRSAPHTNQVWENTSGGTLRWGAIVKVTGASALRLHLTQVILTPAARLWVYGEAGNDAGPFGADLVGPQHELWTPIVTGETIGIDIELPADDKARFVLDGVVELFTGTHLGASRSAALAGANCTVDASCVSDSTVPLITELHRAVALLIYNAPDGTSHQCTGSLLNTNPSTLAPYLLTAYHCFSTQSSASSLVAYWDYETSSCNAAEPSFLSFPSTAGATLLAADPSSDFTFVRLSGSLPAGRYYFGWDATVGLANATILYRLTHPQDPVTLLPRPLQFSEDVFTSFPAYTCSYPQQAIYSLPVSGSALPGMSGAAVFYQNGYVIGQQYGRCHQAIDDPCNFSSYYVSAGAFSNTFHFVSSWLAPQLTVSLQASPSSGPADLGTVLTATVGGSAQGPINYTFWWNCASADTSVAAVMAVCGSIAATCTNTSIGNKCNNSTDNPKVVVTDYPQPGTYTAKIIVERGGAMPAEARVPITVTACYRLSLAASPPSGGSAVTPTANNCTGGYLPGTQVSLSATPASGYSFSTWTASGGSLGSPAVPNTTFMISADATVTANFAALPTCNTLVTKVQPAAAGSVSVLTPSNCPSGYLSGTNISLSAGALGQTSFSGWTGTGGSFSDLANTQTVFTITANAVVTALFGAPGLKFYTISPCRVIDTRNSSGPLGGPSLSGGSVRFFTVAGTCGIPLNALAISVNVTAVVPAASGYLLVFAGDQPAPGTSTVNFSAGQVRANNAIVGLASNGAGTIAVQNAGPGRVDVLVDVNGYWQ